MNLELFNFKAVVTRINLDRRNDLNRIPGTIDCLPDAPRIELRNVRLISPLYTQTFSYSSALQAQQANNFTAQIINPGLLTSLAQAGFWHMPNIGDIGVVGFLNGYADYAVWYGSLMPSLDPRINPPAGPDFYENGNNLSTNNTQYSSSTIVASEQASPFRRQDAIWFHETGSFLRFRNRAVEVKTFTDSSGTTTPRNFWDGKTLIPEVTLQHGSGTNLTITQELATPTTNPPTPAVPNLTTLTLTFVSNGVVQKVLQIDPNENMTWNVLGNVILQTIANPNFTGIDTNGDILFADAFGNKMQMTSAGITVITNGTTNSITFSSDGSGAKITANNSPLYLMGNGSVYLNTNSNSHPVPFGDVLLSILTLLNGHTHLYNPGPGTPTPTGPNTPSFTTTGLNSSSVFTG